MKRASVKLLFLLSQQKSCLCTFDVKKSRFFLDYKYENNIKISHVLTGALNKSDNSR